MSAALSTIERQAIELAHRLEHAPECRLRTSHTETMWQYRSYQGGTPASAIDWRQSGKGRELLVREHEKIRHRTTYFWASFESAEEARMDVSLILLALGHLLVRKERRIGWACAGLPHTQTVSQITPLFETGFSQPVSYDHDKLHNAYVLLTANVMANEQALHHMLSLSAAQGNRGVVFHIGGEPPPSDNAIMATCQKLGWPLVILNRNERTDLCLLHLFEKSVQATR